MALTKREKRKRNAAILVMVTAFLVPYCTWENKAIQLTEYDYESAEIPPEFDGFRVVQISDLHNTMCGSNQYYLMSRVKEAEPDIIVLTGDVIDGNHPDVETAMCFVRQAVALAPTYYITGNHEFCSGGAVTELETQLRDCGVKLLDETSEVLNRDGAAITLVGFQNSYSVTRQQHKLTEQAETDFVLLLAHNPFLFEEFADTDADLALTGHAHGGQIRLPFLGGLYAPDQGFLPDYTCGTYEKDDFTMIVSRGIGNSSFPQRLWNRPEVVVVELSHSDDTKGGQQT